MPQFVGTALTFSDDAIARAAAAIGCDVATVESVITVESRGGFLPDKRPKILFERHVFSRETGRRYDREHPAISSRAAGGYRGGAAEYERLLSAIALDRTAALRSASWGAFQVMGFNHRLAGYDDVETFCTAMCRSEDDHLTGFVALVKANRLADELCRRDWQGFARGYNGPEYRRNRYDEKLAAAYLLHATPPRTAAAARTLRLGDTGDDVRRLQATLGTKADGDFGPATKQKLIAWQTRAGLKTDGVAGPATLRALGLA